MMKTSTNIALCLLLLLGPMSAKAQHPGGGPDSLYKGSPSTSCICHSFPVTTSGGKPISAKLPGYLQTRHSVAYDSSAFLNKKSAACIQCHTTGWDTTVVNAGADEYVNLVLNSKGVRDSVVVTNATEFTKRVNVGCESCHKPYKLPQTTYDSSFAATKCLPCHGALNDHSPTYVDWSFSKHSKSKYTTLPIPGGFRQTASDPNCTACHTAEGFVQFVGQTALTPNVVVPDTSKTVGLTCAGCHDPHSKANPGQLRLPLLQFCQKCHNPEYSPDSVNVVLAKPGTPAVHHSTAWMFEGKGGYEYAGSSYPSSAHKFVVTNKCVVCHLKTAPFQAGPPVVPGYTGHTFNPQKSACADAACHGSAIDTSAANPTPFNFRRTQTVTDSLATVLSTKLSRATKLDSATVAFKRAKFNYDFYEGEGSHGIHNTKYAQALLTTSIANFTPTGVEELPSDVPVAYELKQNYPNPFNPSTTIDFSLAGRQNVRLEVFDILGKLVTTLVNQEMPSGTYRVVWEGADRNGSKVASGIYFYRIDAGSFNAVRKMLLVK